jgi:hypothetical protein
MPYTVVFGPRNEAKIAGTRTTTASEALLIIQALQKAHQEIKFIRSPHEGEIGIEMVRVLAKEEAEEFPAVPDA